jgi:hypothetical protein
MAKLIGTDPNQVPTNADLGTMAYQDYDVVDKEFRNSRPNLVINGDFQVWQRSDNANGSGYVSVDRLKATRGRIRKPNTISNGIQRSGEEDRGCILDTTDGSVFGHFDMFIEDVGQKLAGKEAVMSFEAKTVSSSAFGLYMENAGNSGYGRLDTGGNNTITVPTDRFITIVLRGTITYDGSGEYFRLPRWYVNPTGGGLDRMLHIDKLKVELVEDGHKNPTPFISKPYHEELRDCQRYFQTIENGNLVGARNTGTRLRIAASFMNSMRNTPTISRVSGTTVVMQIDGNGINSTATNASQGTTCGTTYMAFDLGSFTGSVTDRSYIGASSSKNIVFHADAEL